MRLIRFYKRFKNQYRIHKHGLPLRVIVRIAWLQSKTGEKEKMRTQYSKEELACKTCEYKDCACFDKPSLICNITDDYEREEGEK